MEAVPSKTITNGVSPETITPALPADLKNTSFGDALRQFGPKTDVNEWANQVRAGQALEKLPIPANPVLPPFDDVWGPQRHTIVARGDPKTSYEVTIAASQAALPGATRFLNSLSDRFNFIIDGSSAPQSGWKLSISAKPLGSDEPAKEIFSRIDQFTSLYKTAVSQDLRHIALQASYDPQVTIFSSEKDGGGEYKKLAKVYLPDRKYPDSFFFLPEGNLFCLKFGCELEIYDVPKQRGTIFTPQARQLAVVKDAKFDHLIDILPDKNLIAANTANGVKFMRIERNGDNIHSSELGEFKVDGSIGWLAIDPAKDTLTLVHNFHENAAPETAGCKVKTISLPHSSSDPIEILTDDHVPGCSIFTYSGTNNPKIKILGVEKPPDPSFDHIPSFMQRLEAINQYSDAENSRHPHLII